MNIETLVYALAALAGVVALALLVGRFARMSGLAQTLGAKRLVIAERLAIDPRRRVLLLRCDGREVVILTGPRDIVIGWLDQPERQS